MFRQKEIPQTIGDFRVYSYNVYDKFFRLIFLFFAPKTHIICRKFSDSSISLCLLALTEEEKAHSVKRMRGVRQTRCRSPDSGDDMRHRGLVSETFLTRRTGLDNIMLL